MATKESSANMCKSILDIEGTKFHKVMSVLQEVNTIAPEIYNEIGTEFMFDIKLLTTDVGNRPAGLGRELLRRSVELAKVLGFKACKAGATSELNIFHFIPFFIRVRF